MQFDDAKKRRGGRKGAGAGAAKREGRSRSGTGVLAWCLSKEQAGLHRAELSIDSQIVSAHGGDQIEPGIYVCACDSVYS
jgi:hypothetical protein